jgi:hypothetical protein
MSPTTSVLFIAVTASGASGPQKGLQTLCTTCACERSRGMRFQKFGAVFLVELLFSSYAFFRSATPP